MKQFIILAFVSISFMSFAFADSLEGETSTENCIMTAESNDRITTKSDSDSIRTLKGSASESSAQ